MAQVGSFRQREFPDSDKGSGINQSDLPPILYPAISWATPKHREASAGACATSASPIEAKRPAVVGGSWGLSVTPACGKSKPASTSFAPALTTAN